MSTVSASSSMPPRELCAAFSGHRPKSLPWHYNEADPRCICLKERLAEQIEAAYLGGARYFLSGMADGVDMYAAEAVLRLKNKLPDIRLVAVFPYGAGQTKRQRRAAELAELVISLFPEYVTGCTMARNRFLIEHSSMLISVFSGEYKSGTAATMRMAAEAGLRITVLGV